MVECRESHVRSFMSFGVTFNKPIKDAGFSRTNSTRNAMRHWQAIICDMLT
jgi:hypothetical protein